MENNIYHYGVKGMKWGVRRYQNRDGSLTSAGKERFRQVSSDQKLADRDTKRAIKKLKNDAKVYDRYEKQYRRNKTLKNHLIKADEYFEKSKTLHKKISDIESGKVKAGRDFITAYRYDISMRGLALQISRRTTIIKKNDNVDI